MVKLFGNLILVLAIGVALAVLMMLFPDSGYRPPTGDLINGVLQWLHFFFGITWIGLLYYFNFVQGSFFAETDPSTKSNAIQKLVPRALWWFRWAAMYTMLTGIIYLAIKGHLMGSAMFETSWGIA